jgi:hypothetical protein
MTWQLHLRDELVSRLPAFATHWTAGSVLDRDQLDQWSDLDLHVDLGGSLELVDLFAGLDVWAASEDFTAEQQVLRVVLRDGRRVDLVVDGGRIRVPAPGVDNDIRMIAALAAAKLGRGDRLIGLHLTLDLMRWCLVQAMLLRDRDLGTRIHRFGSARDAMTEEVAELVRGPIRASPRPNVVERTVELYGRWRGQLDPEYAPDWSGLDELLTRGLARG